MGRSETAKLEQINSPMYRLTLELTADEYTALVKLVRAIEQTTTAHYADAGEETLVKALNTTIKRAL